MKKIILVAMLAFIATIGFAQHCPWDGSSFIMVAVKGSPGFKLQKIYLLDSNGAKVTSKHYYGEDKFEVDTAKFWKNIPSGQMGGKWKYDKQYFSFAKNYQILAFGQYKTDMAYSLLLVYSQGKTGHTKRISIANDDIHVLCTLNKELWGGKLSPVSITL